MTIKIWKYSIKWTEMYNITALKWESCTVKNIEERVVSVFPKMPNLFL